MPITLDDHLTIPLTSRGEATPRGQAEGKGQPPIRRAGRGGRESRGHELRRIDPHPRHAPS
jgi:hypothetical protein